MARAVRRPPPASSLSSGGSSIKTRAECKKPRPGVRYPAVPLDPSPMETGKKMNQTQRASTNDRAPSRLEMAPRRVSSCRRVNRKTSSPFMIHYEGTVAGSTMVSFRDEAVVAAWSASPATPSCDAQALRVSHAPLVLFSRSMEILGLVFFSSPALFSSIVSHTYSLAASLSLPFSPSSTSGCVLY